MLEERQDYACTDAPSMACSVWSAFMYVFSSVCRVLSKRTPISQAGSVLEYRAYCIARSVWQAEADSVGIKIPTHCAVFDAGGLSCWV